MHTIEVDDDVRRFLLTKTERFGESANDILRRLFAMNRGSAQQPNRNGLSQDKDQKFLHTMRMGLWTSALRRQNTCDSCLATGRFDLVVAQTHGSLQITAAKCRSPDSLSL